MPWAPGPVSSCSDLGAMAVARYHSSRVGTVPAHRLWDSEAHFRQQEEPPSQPPVLEYQPHSKPKVDSCTPCL